MPNLGLLAPVQWGQPHLSPAPSLGPPTPTTSGREPRATGVLICVPTPALTGALQSRDLGSPQKWLVLATVLIRGAARLPGPRSPCRVQVSVEGVFSWESLLTGPEAPAHLTELFIDSVRVCWAGPVLRMDRDVAKPSQPGSSSFPQMQ